MAKGNDAADAIRRIVKMFEQLGVAASILDEYGSFENAVAEANKRMAEAKEEEAAIREGLDKAKEDLANAKLEVKELIANAKKKAEGVVETAAKKAEDQLNAAVVDAQRKIAEADSEANDRKEKAKMIVNAIETKLAGLYSACDVKQKELDEIEAKAADAQKKLDGIKSKLAKLLADE